MDPIILISGITSYILSLVIGLLLAVAAHRFSRATISRLIAIHFVLICLLITALVAGQFMHITTNYLSYLSMITLCSGVIFSGLVLRTSFSWLTKSYFSIYILSVILFAASPSKLFSFVATGHIYSNSDNRFNITQNYYLESQQALIQKTDTGIRYKVYQRIGYFNKTMVRDINFGFRVDSIKTIHFEKNNYAILRGYTLKSTEPDSSEIKIDFQTSLKTNTITKGK